MHCMHRLIFLFSVFALATIQPAAAQFEVSPDHFDRPAVPQTQQSMRAEQKLKDNIADEQALLQSYKEQLAAEVQKVEDLRQELISAGINGDGADQYRTALLSEQEELQTLQASLAPRMDFSQAVIAGLNNDLDRLETGATSGSSGSRRSSSTLQASARTGR